MDLKTYQEKVEGMPLYDDLLYGAMTELGEVVDIIKKGSRPGRKIDVVWLSEEIGDVFWYLTRLASKYGLSVEAILNYNIEKLEKRHANN